MVAVYRKAGTGSGGGWRECSRPAGPAGTTVTSVSNSDIEDLPLFPAVAPDEFGNPALVKALLAEVMDKLSKVVEIPSSHLAAPTPCRDYNVAQLRHHVLGWLQFFAAALADPEGQSERIDPVGWEFGTDSNPGDVVNAAHNTIEAAVDAGVAGELVVMSEAKMSGSAVLAMAFGEYIVHGWDLARSTGKEWQVADQSCILALAFLEGTVVPEYRGPESGFFDDQVPAAADASALDKLLAFAGRDPGWSPS